MGCDYVNDVYDRVEIKDYNMIFILGAVMTCLKYMALFYLNVLLIQYISKKLFSEQMELMRVEINKLIKKVQHLEQKEKLEEERFEQFERVMRA